MAAPVMLAPGASVTVTPASPTTITSCIPFGDNLGDSFAGIIYRGAPAFYLPAGAKRRFDLGDLNDRPTQRNIFFGAANTNPAPGWLSGTDVL